MKTLVLSAVLMLGVVLASQAGTSSKCSKPKNYQNCAGYCDDLRECKKCCARGNFSDAFFNKCISRCNTVFVKSGDPGQDPGRDPGNAWGI